MQNQDSGCSRIEHHTTLHSTTGLEGFLDLRAERVAEKVVERAAERAAATAGESKEGRDTVASAKVLQSLPLTR